MKALGSPRSPVKFLVCSCEGGSWGWCMMFKGTRRPVQFWPKESMFIKVPSIISTTKEVVLPGYDELRIRLSPAISSYDMLENRGSATPAGGHNCATELRRNLELPWARYINHSFRPGTKSWVGALHRPSLAPRDRFGREKQGGSPETWDPRNAFLIKKCGDEGF